MIDGNAAALSQGLRFLSIYDGEEGDLGGHHGDELGDDSSLHSDGSLLLGGEGNSGRVCGDDLGAEADERDGGDAGGTGQVGRICVYTERDRESYFKDMYCILTGLTDWKKKACLLAGWW